MYISKEDSVRALHSSELQPPPFVLHQTWIFVALNDANECRYTNTHTLTHTLKTIVELIDFDGSQSSESSRAPPPQQ